MYPFRWFVVVLIGLAGFMTYADLTGWRLLSTNQEQWNASGVSSGSHK
ncbi:MAG: hypothetical protein WCF67_12800 [Chitinophagaceae bacterium]